MFGTIPGMPVPVTTTYGLTPCAAVAVCVPMTPQRKYARPPTPLYVRFAAVPAVSADVLTVGCAKSE